MSCKVGPSVVSDSLESDCTLWARLPVVRASCDVAIRPCEKSYGVLFSCSCWGQDHKVQKNCAHSHLKLSSVNYVLHVEILQQFCKNSIGSNVKLHHQWYFNQSCCGQKSELHRTQFTVYIYITNIYINLSISINFRKLALCWTYLLHANIIYQMPITCECLIIASRNIIHLILKIMQVWLL